MNKKSLQLFVTPIVALLLMAVSSDANADLTIKKIVNCDKGMNVQRVLDRNFFSLPMELRLVGKCPAFSISHDDVAIFPRYDDVCPGATIEGQIEIEGGAIVEMSCIDVVNSPDEDEIGLLIAGSQATFENVNVQGFEAGVQVDQGGWIEFIEGTLSGNDEGLRLAAGWAYLEGTVISGNGVGIGMDNTAYVEFDGGSITNNTNGGIRAVANSVLVIQADVLNNGGSGIFVDDGSRVFIGGKVEGNDGAGVELLNQSSASIGGSISENLGDGIALSWHSTARLNDGAEVLSNSGYGVVLSADSGVELGEGTSVLGNGDSDVKCFGTESSVETHSNTVIGTVACDHPGF